MRSVFIDTSGFYAALNRKDAAHREARHLFRQAREERWFLFTTNIQTYQDKDFSYCDAISFAVMERLGISEAISFDKHFRQYGKFVTL